MKAIWHGLINTAMALVVGSVLLGLGIIIAREWLLWQGVQGVKKDLTALRRLSAETSCEEKFGLTLGEGEAMYRQLRFTSPRDYMLELVCPGFPEQPLVQQRRMLSSFISKVPGGAGIVEHLDGTESSVGLMVFQEVAKSVPAEWQSRVGWIFQGEQIGLKAGEIVTKPLETDAALTSLTQFGVGPVSNCEGYGFTCCDAQTQYGMGDAVNDVPTCPGNCYARCLQRPLVVSWRSNPLPDWESGMVELPKGGSVDLFYVVEDRDEAGPWTAVIDFGDGQETAVDGKNGMTQHLYDCQTNSCEYTATVSVINAHGARSAETELAKLKIFVSEPLPTELIY